MAAAPGTRILRALRVILGKAAVPTMPVRRRHDWLPAGDAVLWLIGALAGAVAVHTPDFVVPLGSAWVRLLVQCGAFFSLGCVLGVLAPSRPWRWAVAAMLLVPVSEWLWRLQPVTPQHGLDVEQLPRLIQEHAGRYLTLGMAALIGAVLSGAVTSPR